MNRQGEGFGYGIYLHGIERLEAHLDRSNNRVVLALVTLGLYITGSLVMQHSLGPRLFGDIPALAAFAYGSRCGSRCAWRTESHGPAGCEARKL